MVMSRKLILWFVSSSREPYHITTNIYRKPTTTDSNILNDSCHPTEQKMAAIRFLYNKMNSYSLTDTNMQTEKDTIQQILINNKYDPSTIGKIKQGKEKTYRQKQNTERTEGTKWAKFT
jgi:hypothetical protein